MPSLLNETEKNNLTPLIEDLFDTFARDIIIHKEPKKIIKNINTNSLVGYNESANLENYEYIPESRTFKAKIKYENQQDLSSLTHLGGLKNFLSQGVVKIKVRQDARDYILDGRKTEKIVFDNKTFNIISDESVKRFFNTVYYVFYLQSTK
jgi:hypothetical protein